jgi:hypothetical protein
VKRLPKQIPQARKKAFGMTKSMMGCDVMALVGGGPDLVGDYGHHEEEIEAEGPEDY